LHDDYIGLCGFVDCDGGIAGSDWDAYSAYGWGEYEYDTSRYDGVCVGAGLFYDAEY
jgi:hypothetical protein